MQRGKTKDIPEMIPSLGDYLHVMAVTLLSGAKKKKPRHPHHRSNERGSTLGTFEPQGRD